VESLSDILGTSALALALAACAGIRAWLPLFLAGLAFRAGLFSFGPSYAFLGSNRALVLFGVATFVEIVADKIPAVDHALDLASTVVRPAAGALLAASVFGRITDPALALGLGIALGAPAALIPHAGKASFRAATTVATAGLGNPVVSTAEDLGTVVLFGIALLAPFLVLVPVLVIAFLVARKALQRSPQPAEPR
jgi:hypothetical protein